MFRTLFHSLALVLIIGCAKEPAFVPAPQVDKGVPAMKITSTAFQEGGTIPKQYTGDGLDVSPLLQWSGVPAGVKSFALICDDPDAPDPEAPKMTWVHWVIFNIPADKHELPEGLMERSAVKTFLGVKQGLNDFKKIGYGGPAPPRGSKPHRYFFKLYALDTILDLKEGAGKQQLEEAMKGHILAQGQLMGRYSR